MRQPDWDDDSGRIGAESALGGDSTCPPGGPPGWNYVNVRRHFVYIEHFIEEGGHWAVFELN